jgi:glycosyltransferase involved in cell wall biosynthesis
MKIVFLSFYSGLVDRGVETLVHELASHLTKNHEITVIIAGKPKNDVTYNQIKIPIEIETVERHDLSIEHKLGLDYYYRKITHFTFKSLKHLIKIKPDIIIPLNGSWQAFIIRFFTLFNKSKMVVSGQAGLGWDEKWNLSLRPDLFVSLSKRNDQWVKERFSKQKTVVIPNGVDLNKFKPGQKTNIFKLHRPVILTVAGSERFKRVEETISAVSSLDNASLIVVGGNNNTQTLGKKLLGKQFKQIKLKYEEMPDIYRSADLFTLVSDSQEAFGISYLEALATNLPVVATNDPMRQEIIQKSGLYVDNPKNSQEYAQVLKTAIKKEWGNLPRETAQNYSWEEIAKQYEKAFTMLLSKNKKANLTK